MNATLCIGAAIAAISMIVPLTGCAQKNSMGRIELTALGSKPLVLERDFAVGSYTELESEFSFWFSDVTFEALASHSKETPLPEAIFLHAQIIWQPEPGRTPLVSTATNVVTRIVIISGGELGLYGGAAFARPDEELGGDSVEFDLRGGTLTLLAKTAGFHDLLSPVGLTGRLTAKRSNDEASKWRRGVSQLVTNTLGRSMWVSAPRRDDALGAFSLLR